MVTLAQKICTKCNILTRCSEDFYDRNIYDCICLTLLGNELLQELPTIDKTMFLSVGGFHGGDDGVSFSTACMIQATYQFRFYSWNPFGLPK